MICLLRHGEIKGGKRFLGSTDDPLTPQGITQVQAATSDPFHCDLVISSPLVRCASFAKQYATKKSIPLRLEPRLAEMHFGDWEGQTSKQIYDRSPRELTRFWSDPQRYPPPNGERLLDFRKRVLLAFEEIIEQYPDQHSLLITHGGVIRLLMCYLQNLPLEKIMDLEVGYGALICFKRHDNKRFARMGKR